MKEIGYFHINFTSAMQYSLRIAFLLVLLAFSTLSDCENGVCWGGSQYSIESSTLLLHAVDKESKVESSSKAELMRFVQASRYSTLTGSSHSEIAAKVNKYAAAHQSVRRVIPCRHLTLEGVTILAAKLQPFIDASIWQSFPPDDGRQVNLLPWKSHDVGLSAKAHRDALCAETMKLWSHHISKSVKQSALDVTLPSLPTVDFEALGLNITDLGNEARMYNKSLSCVAGHTAGTADLSSLKDGIYDWPHWPTVGHWREKGHGPYPFWQFGPPSSSWHLNESFTTPYLYAPGNDMEVWHSTLKQATKFYHSACEWQWLGFPELGTQPCVGLMLHNFSSSGRWYVYTADPTSKATDSNFCCESTWYNHNGLNLGTINRKFIDEMIYVDTSNFTGDYYQGLSKRYILAMDYTVLHGGPPESGDEPVLYINVFYETDLEGRPLRFGEWGQDLVFDGYLHDTDLPLMYEEFDPTSWTDQSLQDFSDDVFDLPAVCNTTTHGCGPGRINREVSDDVNFPED